MIDINVRFDSSTNTIILKIVSDATDIKDIWIDTQKTFNCGEEHSSSAWHYEITEETPNTVYYQDESNNYIFDYIINLDDITTVNALFQANVNTDLFFVYVSTGNYCEELKLVYNEEYLRNMLFNNLYSSLTNNKCCEVDNSALDMLLLYDAFKLATINKDKVYFWNILHIGQTLDNNSNCMCNG